MDIDLNLQITICTFLRLSDIRQRIIWVEALRPICLEKHTVFTEFSYERCETGIAPRRWTELSTSFANRDLNDSPTATRITNNPFAKEQLTSLFLVPGQHLVAYSKIGFGAWDLGYTPRLIASVEPKGGSTPDGTGLVIYSLRPLEHCSFYEIYPQSEIPRLSA